MKDGTSVGSLTSREMLYIQTERGSTLQSTVSSEVFDLILIGELQ